MFTSICWYLRILPVLHRPEVVNIGVYTVICLNDYILQSCLSIQYVHGDLCTHLGINSSTYRYSNLFINAYINRHVHAKYLKMILFYSLLGIWHVFLYSVNTNI